MSKRMGCLLPCFNPRICKRCDLSFASRYITTFRFNPRICKRCDSVEDVCNTSDTVSIHASVKDATYNPQRRDPLRLVSIHASVKDATMASAAVTLSLPFQSTHL